MKKNYFKRFAYFFLFFLIIASDCMAESGVYVGGHIRRERPGTITKLKESGFTYVILFNINVESDGTLKTDGETVCSNGQYVFGNTQPYYVSDIQSLKASPTNINRIEVCIGGWGNTSYTNIKNIIASQGTGSSSILYRNFQALKNAIPAIDAVNNDDEYTYDVNSSAAFHIMMSDLGYKTTLAPYMNKTFWQNLATNINNSRSGAVDRILLQCYDGGAGNNPADWHINNIPLHAGRMNYEDFSTSLSLMQSWKNNAGVVGGFFWVYNDETWSLNTYATAVNRIFGAKTTSAAVATFCSDINYGGYNIGLPIGSFTTADLAAYGITNDDISSFKVNSGYKVTVYNDNNFSGTSTSYTSDQSNVGSTYNDQISSIKIYKSTTAPAATFYPDVNFGGFPAALPLGTFTADELAAYGIKNDDITSLKVNSGYRVVLYTDNNFSGTSVTYISDQSWIGDYNDKISSIQIYKYSSSPEATFYHNVNYGGSSVGLPQGTYTAEEMAAYGIKNDDITSLKINSGYRVVLYTDNNFSGTSINYTSDQSWIGDFNDKISSIQIYKYSSSPVSTFYSDVNYGGSSIGLPLGTYTTADLASYGIKNDDITSLKVNSGYKVIAYMDNNFGGSSVSYTSDQSNVGTTYNDEISSIQIYRYSANGAATCYSDINYGGFAAGLPLGTYTTSELAEYGIQNDDITSIKVNSGYRVVLYTDNNFSGTSVTYISDQSWIGDYNDKISSIQIYKYSSSPEATFYHNVNYGGSSVGLPQGTYTAEEMAAYGIKNDDITSLKINSGYRVVLYTDNNFSGTSINYTSDQSWIGDFNDKISSIQIYKYSSSPVSTFYSDVNYGGSSIGLPLGTYTTADLASYGIKNDDITSLKVNSGYKVIAYMDNNFGGSSVSYTSDQSNVGTTYNDEISSIQIYRYSANGAATCYSDINYGGFAAGLPLGTYTTSELAEYGIQNDDITSIKVNSGYKVIAYMDNNFTGTSVSYTSDQSNVSTTYNDKISSIQIYRYSTDAVATFYADANYAGFAAGLPLGTYTLSQLQEYGITDNSITSLKVNSGYKVIAYVDVNFSEASILFTSDQSNIGSTYNDRISSIQIYKYSTDAVASFYNSDNSQGTSTGLPTGLFTTAEMNKYGIADNSITSFDLQSGYQVTLYADDNFSGTSASYTAGQGWLYDMNDQTSSIKIYPVFGSDITDNGGTVTASHSAVSSSETIDKLTDNNALTKYCANVSAGTTVWMQYQSAASVTLQSYSLTSANDSQSRDPKAWTLQASNNGTDWTVIDTQTNQIFATRYLKKTFTVNTSNAYMYFRLVVTERYESSATIFQLSEFQLFGSSTLMGIKTNNTTFNEATTTEIVESNLYELKIYPNPAVNFINVNMPSSKLTLKYAVYNTIGVCVQTGELNNGDKVNVQSLTSGIYQLVLTDNDRRVVHQFLKTR